MKSKIEMQNVSLRREESHAQGKGKAAKDGPGHGRRERVRVKASLVRPVTRKKEEKCAQMAFGL